jgi:GT2 family glycosyltransferase
MTVSVVIPTYNNYSGLHQLLFDLYKNCELIEEVIVVDDASPNPEVQKGLEWWKSTNMLPLEVVTLRENMGFLRASNLGMSRHAVENTICLISTDVRVFGDIVSYVKQVPPQILIGGRVLDFDTGWNTFGGKIYPYVEGWCLCAHRDLWETCGFFDERYAPNDFEDVDLSTTAISLDYHLKQFPDGYVQHEGGKSIGYSSSREELTKTNREKFSRKWVK